MMTLKNWIDEIYCISVNDSFVMNAWANITKLIKLKLYLMEMVNLQENGNACRKKQLGFGYRSWRYAALIDNCKIIESFVEPGFEDNCEDDPYEMSSPQIILEYLKENKMAV